ncbi:hypothetical protein FGB62_292g011 [Gracilaria domingensis]|nr:hypothetical protein FGB62_292g011 [Gracilaria domingensis]
MKVPCSLLDHNRRERARQLWNFLFTMSTEHIGQQVIDFSDFDQIFNYLEQDLLKNSFRFVPEPVYHDFITECEQLPPQANLQTNEEKQNIQRNKIPALLISSILEDAAESNEVSPTFISDQTFTIKTDSLLSVKNERSKLVEIKDGDETSDTRLQTANDDRKRDVEYSNAKFECLQHMRDAQRDENPADKELHAA